MRRRVDSLIRPAGPDAGFASIYLHTHERMIENVALSSRIGYVEYRRDAQGAFTLARIALGSGRRPEVVITIGGHTRRSRVASMGGRFIVGISAANRAASGIAEGDVVEVGLRLDAEPRVVAEPPDLADALDRAPRPAPRSTGCPMASSASTCGPSRAPRAPDAAAAHRQADHHDRRRPRCQL